MPPNVTDRVIAIIAEQAVLDVSDVTAASRLDSLGIDSLGLVEAIFAIEEAFDIQVPFNANQPAQSANANQAAQSAFDISTVASIVAGVEALIAARIPVSVEVRQA